MKEWEGGGEGEEIKQGFTSRKWGVGWGGRIKQGQASREEGEGWEKR